MTTSMPLEGGRVAPQSGATDQHWRARVEALVAFAAAESGTVSDEDLSVAIASGDGLAAIREAACRGYEECAAGMARGCDDGRLLERSRADLDGPFETMLLFFVPHRSTQFPRHVIAAATVSGAVSAFAPSFGARARIWTLAPPVRRSIADHVAARHGSWYAWADLASAVALAHEREPENVPLVAHDAGLACAWLCDGVWRERDERASGESLRPSNGGVSVPVIDPVPIAPSELLRSERIATLGWLAASVGHDLRTPLSAIRSNSAMAVSLIERIESENVDGAEGLRILRQLETTNLEAAGRLAEIVAGLKAFAHPVESAVRRCEVRAVVDQVLMLCRHELRQVHVERCDDADLPAVAVPHAELMQVLMNLLVNAATMLHERGGTVRIVARTEGDVVAITVADDGPGLAADVRERLFRTGVTTRAAHGGSGLGLMIVKRIVDANGGRIDVTSEPSAGASFRVTFPRAES